MEHQTGNSAPTRSTFTWARLKRPAIGPYTPIMDRVESGQLPFDDAIDQLLEMEAEYVRAFPEAIERLNQQLTQLDPCTLLATVNTYALLVSLDYDPELEEEQPLLQHHVEVLQALLLQRPLTAYPAKHLLTPVELADLKDTVQRVWLGSASSRRQIRQPGAPSTLRMQIPEQMRSYTMFLRNWGTPNQIHRIVAGMFEEADGLIHQETGVRVAALLHMGEALLRHISQRVQKHLRHVQQIWMAATPAEVAHIFCDAFTHEGDVGTSAVLEAIQQLCHTEAFDLDTVKAILVGMTHDDLPDAYTFTLEDALRAYPEPVSETALARILASWSLAFGDLRQDDAEAFFLNNPVWRRPIIQLPTGQYFWPIPALFFSFCTELMEDAVLVNEAVKRKYAAESRAHYLEAQICDLFAGALPGAEIYRGVKWAPSGTKQEHESDVLVIVDSTIIIVEAKSGRITHPARRGSEPRIKREVEKLIVEAARQSQRFAAELAHTESAISLTDRGKRAITLDPTRFHQVLRLIVTLDDFGTVGAYWPQLIEAKLIDIDVAPAPVFSLAHLENVLKALNGPSERLHYIAKRSVLESRYNYIADEMDLLGAYIARDLDFDDVGDKEATFIDLLGASKLLDGWLLSELSTHPIAKPKRTVTPWWRELIAQVEAERFPRWTEAAVMLLNVSLDHQSLFETACREGAARTRRMAHKSVLGHAAHMLPGHAEEGVIVAAIYKGLSNRQLRVAVNPYIQAIKGADAYPVVVIALDVKTPQQACQTVWVQ